MKDSQTETIQSESIAEQTGLNQKSLKKSYDYIIVGAGSAGCVIARRLIESTTASVLLLEAGGMDAGIDNIHNPALWPANIGSPVDYFYRNEPTPLINNRTILVPRGKVLGGSGSINAMVWARGSKADYDGWAAAGNKGWDYNSVLPLFKKIEDWEGGESDFHGAGGPIRIVRPREMHAVTSAFIEAGRSYGMPYLEDANGIQPEGIGPMSMNIRDGKRDSSANGYLRPILNHQHLTVVTKAKVSKLNFNGTECTGLDFIQAGVKHKVNAANEVILSAGAIDTPRILMLSGIGDEDDLQDLGIETLVNLPGVGKNMQDHPMVHGLCFEANEPIHNVDYNLMASVAYWKSNTALSEPDLMFLPFQVPLLTTELAQQYPPAANSFSIIPRLVKPKSRGYVKMKTAQHDGPMEIQTNYLQHPDDLTAMMNSVEIAMDIAAQPAMRKLIKNWIAPKHKIGKTEVETFVRDGLSSYFHQTGTCAMGSARESVVDSNLCVYGTTRLRIADASVMPEITASNTNAPTMMIAEHAAQMLLAVH